ncbi:hypothetical protein K3495_g4775 [Podosphaera aphanis]|nr:hypothetical protein K3495_g4775 [Podosphaera aphanis]
MYLPSEEIRMRTNDYICDKLQTISDLEDLESLISKVKIQQKQLEQQLQNAQIGLSEAKLAESSQTSAILAKTMEFEKQRTSVQTRIRTVNSSEAVELALSKLKNPMEKLHRLELAQSYIKLLVDSESLKDKALRHLPESPKLALQPYTKLKELSKSLQCFHESAEGAAVHLVTHIQQSTVDLMDEMKRVMCDHFDKKLQASKWPDPEFDKLGDWSQSFGKLLDLQIPELTTGNQSNILLPLVVMAKPFVLQFKYHFFSDKPTNHPFRLGDYFFQWFLRIVSKWEGFLRENVGPILVSHFRETVLADISVYVDPVAAFIFTLLPVLREKVKNLSKEISGQPQHLSRFMIQTMDFDDTVRTRFRYNEGNPEHEWRGLTGYILETSFDNWFEAEKKFALDRYRDIIHAKDSGDIDYDASGSGKTKTTFGATQITDLIATITTKYHRVRKLSHKMNFLIGIQAEILDHYLGRLNDALEYYQTATSTVGRTIHGVTKEEVEELQGIKGLERLCRVFCSSEHLISTLKDWTNDEFFIMLYDQLQSRMTPNDLTTKVAGNMTADEVKECTSRSVGSTDDGSLFDLTIEGFERLRNNAESLIAQAIEYELPSNFRPYLINSEWVTIYDGGILSTSGTPELDRPLHVLHEYVQFLRQVLADVPLRRVMRRVLKKLEDLLYNDLLVRQEFSLSGSIRFSQDVTKIIKLINSWTRLPSHSPLDMPKLREGVGLLSLSDISAKEGLSFKEVVRAIFSSNLEATEVLRKLNLVHLSKTDARTILGRRVDESAETEKGFEER